MSRMKTSAKKVTEPQEENSVIREERTSSPASGVRIVYQGTCPKLTTRGRGDLSYELGVEDATGESCIRISANVSSGAFSHEWISLSKLHSLLDQVTSQQKAFSAIAMKRLFTRKSANNCGYLAAILKAEGVLSILPGKPVMLSLESWTTVTGKITTLSGQGIHLTDHIAIATQKRAVEKAQHLANLRSTKSTKSTET